MELRATNEVREGRFGDRRGQQRGKKREGRISVRL